MMISAVADRASMRDVSWPKEITFGVSSRESEPDIECRVPSILAHVERDVGVPMRAMTSTDTYRRIEALRFGKAQAGWLRPSAYVEASSGNYANVEPLAEVQLANGSVASRSCLIVHADWDIVAGT